ncbi:cytochrome P450, partial [Mycena rebaudengoi]
MIPLWLALIALALAIIFFRRKQGPLPPGPPRKPLIGNLLDVPFENPWAAFASWSRKYGDVVYLEVLGNSIVVLNSLETITEFFEKRARNYSHRPVFIMIGELMGLDKAIGLNNRDKFWRQERKLASNILSPLAIKQYIPTQERLATVLLSELEKHPTEFADLLNLATARLILEITYGISIDNMDHPVIKQAGATFELVRKSLQPGAHVVDFLPWLRYIPAWVPFSCHRAAARGRSLIEATVFGPFEYVKAQMEAGTAKPSLVRNLLSNPIDVEGLDFEDVIAWTAGTMYGSGAETTAATLASLVIAMALYPGVQIKAQEELDRVLKGSRLPTMADRASLPYVNAVIQETLRWHVVLPLALPRRADADDIYKGYLIPKNSIILPNVRCVAGEGDYLAGFSPERYINENADSRPDPLSYAFGYGRRACPGQDLAQNSLFIFVASILAAFRITKPVDSRTPTFSAGLISHPDPFKCSIVVRTPETTKLIANQLMAFSTD